MEWIIAHIIGLCQGAIDKCFFIRLLLEKSSMKKLYRSFLSFFTFLAIFLSTRLAYADLCPPGDFMNLCDLKPDKAGGAVGSIVTILSILAIGLELLDRI